MSPVSFLSRRSRCRLTATRSALTRFSRIGRRWTASGSSSPSRWAAFGASLLLQLAIAKFYEVRPERRAGTPVYPEIYLFHVGGPHGDFSYFDFWPPRKEVQVAAAEPVALLEAVNAHAITRLAMPRTAG
jgi:hypothetical protein